MKNVKQNPRTVDWPALFFVALFFVLLFLMANTLTHAQTLSIPQAQVESAMLNISEDTIPAVTDEDVIWELFETLSTLEDMEEWLEWDIQEGRVDAQVAETYLHNIEEMQSAVREYLTYAGR